MNGRDWHSLVAIVLAIGVAASLILLSLVELRTSGHVTAEEATLLSTILGATVGAIATYLGTSNGTGGTLIASNGTKGDAMTEQDLPAPEEPAEDFTFPVEEPTGPPIEEPDEGAWPNDDDPRSPAEQADDATEGMGPGDDVT